MESHAQSFHGPNQQSQGGGGPCSPQEASVSRGWALRFVLPLDVWLRVGGPRPSDEVLMGRTLAFPRWCIPWGGLWSLLGGEVSAAWGSPGPSVGGGLHS